MNFNYETATILRRKNNISLMELKSIDKLSKFLKKKYNRSYEIKTYSDLSKFEDEVAIVFGMIPTEGEYDEYSIELNGNKLMVNGASTNAIIYAVDRLIDNLTYFNDFSQFPFNGKVEGTAVVDGYKLVYSDEFDGDTLSPVWVKHPVCDIGARGNESTPGIKKPCWMSLDNYKVENSHVVLYGSTDGEKYYSAELRSKARLLFKYGYVEFSARFGAGHGFCPAIWLLGLEDPLEYVKPEIDIFECFGDPTQIKATTLVWPGKKNKDFPADNWFGHDINHVNHKAAEYSYYSLEDGELFSEDFHTYALEWDEHQLQWYCDGVPFWRIAIDDANSKRALSFHQEMFIIMTQYAGVSVCDMPYADETTDWENKNKMWVDYVRLYQREGALVNGRVTRV